MRAQTTSLCKYAERHWLLLSSTINVHKQQICIDYEKRAPAAIKPLNITCARTIPFSNIVTHEQVSKCTYMHSFMCINNKYS